MDKILKFNESVFNLDSSIKELLEDIFAPLSDKGISVNINSTIQKRHDAYDGHGNIVNVKNYVEVKWKMSTRHLLDLSNPKNFIEYNTILISIFKRIETMIGEFTISGQSIRIPTENIKNINNELLDTYSDLEEKIKVFKDEISHVRKSFLDGVGIQNNIGNYYTQMGLLIIRTNNQVGNESSKFDYIIPKMVNRSILSPVQVKGRVNMKITNPLWDDKEKIFKLIVRYIKKKLSKEKLNSYFSIDENIIIGRSKSTLQINIIEKISDK
jgi:hypothetical protein